MKSKKKCEKIEITSHGELYEEMHREIRYFICPECGSDDIRTDTYNKNTTKFLDIFEFQERVTSCKCRECKCKFEISDNRHLIKFDVVCVINMIALLCFILTLMLGCLCCITETVIVRDVAILFCILTVVFFVIDLIASTIYGDRR